MPRKRTSETTSPAGGPAAAPAPAKKARSPRARTSSSTRKARPAPEENATVSIASLPEAVSGTAAVDREEIARIAYSYWQARGGVGGSPEDDWYRAESELRDRLSA